MYLKSKKHVGLFHMLDYNLKIDKRDKKAEMLFSFTWSMLRKSKAEQSHSQIELGFARHESNQSGGET